VRVALDTNVLIYAEGLNDEVRRDRALEVIEALPANGVAIPVQVLGEVHRLLVRNGGRTPAQAALAASRWANAFDTLPSTETAMRDALAITEAHGLQIWDALALAVAHAGACALVLSEDMQDGFVWRDVTVLNPFSADGAARLAKLVK
jgi:predicted nucleic acid-binding protein